MAIDGTINLETINLRVCLGAIALVLLLGQLPALALLLARLLPGALRHPPLLPQVNLSDSVQPAYAGQVSVIVPTLNEVTRLSPCLAGLSDQTAELREIIVVDSRSQDGTIELVQAFQSGEPRLQLISDDPLPPGWIGRPWALHTGFWHSSDQSTWILGIDADTQPQPGLILSLLQVAEREGYDLISLAPRFILKGLGELWLQPALLITLVYRFGAAGHAAEGAERVMANGQCFLCRRSLLQSLNGYTSARQSFCDDVTLARYAASQGAKVGFLDGSKVLKVRMYEGMRETWQEWGRSLDLKDACSAAQKWGDFIFLLLVQALPLFAVGLFASTMALGATTVPVQIAFAVNLGLLLLRFGLLFAIAQSYDFSQAQSTWSFWLSPLADPLAVYRIWRSSVQTPNQWRGRSYPLPSHELSG